MQKGEEVCVCVVVMVGVGKASAFLWKLLHTTAKMYV